MSMRPFKSLVVGIGLASLLLSTLCSGAAPSKVKLWQEDLIIPTYKVAAPDPNPRFYSGRTYQGAKATFYPYPVYDRLTDEKENKTYKAVYLENDYIKICVLPELGGRIFSAVDKANNYDFFYRQHVIKPALIGMLGAWISGGVEWNVPHHHRATSFMPVDYHTSINPDGSKTVWLGEIELRHRMKWLIGLTLHPDRSYIEMNCKVFNRTPFAQSMLFWINPAVHANENYQVIFPPDTEWAVQHAKPEFASWPIAHQRYGGTDYSRGVDISWWKNHPNPVSFFCFHSDQDFFGGYDHGKKAGVLHIADHHVVPGKKFFEWGNGPEGEMWTKMLTDEDGHYLELMAGAWSDNQPDYSWIQPGETREWKHFWYPIRNVGGVIAANENGALNLEVTNGVVKIAINTTKVYPKALIRLSRAGHQSYTCETNLSPRNSFSAAIPLESTSKVEELELLVSESKGGDIISYRPQLSRNTPMPKPVERPQSPANYKSHDELYFTGQRIEQLQSPSFEAAPYYEEMLRRDPSDYRAHTALGILLCKQWRWEEAEKHLRAALDRATANYIRPKDGEAFYYLGVALRNQRKLSEKTDSNASSTPAAPLGEAADAFHKAAWSSAWHAAAYYQLAEIACQRHDFARALENINRSLAANSRNSQALNLRSAILRHLSRFEEALQMTAFAKAIDSLDLGAQVEQSLAELQYPSKKTLGINSDKLKQPAVLQNCTVQNRLELGVHYQNAGLNSEAQAVLLPPSFKKHSADNKLRSSQYEYANVNPLLLYQAGGSSDLRHDGNARYETLSKANSVESFPFQFESIDALGAASPDDPVAAYYLGNLLYDNQPERAIQAWETAKALLSSTPALKTDTLPAIIHRNLGWAYAQHQRNPAKSIASYEKAIELNPKDPRYFYELDVQYEAAGISVQKRLEMLQQHHETVILRDDALTREIVLLTVAGKADRALELLRSHHFRTWEGSREIHGVYANACLRQGRQDFAARKYREALRNYEAALEYPQNLEVGRARRDAKTAQAQYLIGTAQEALGNAEQAKAAFEKAAVGRDSGASESDYYHALALQKLGRKDEALKTFERLVSKGQEELEGKEAVDYFAKFGEKQSERVRKANAYYLMGLGYLGQGKPAQAQAEFKKALEQDPGHLGASIQVTRAL